MKKILFAIILFLFPNIVTYAITINNVDMQIYIDNNGNANVTETWDTYSNDDTEVYHSYYDIGNSKIILNSVTMDGKEFEIINDWDINSSFSEKSYKAGLYYPENNSVDICAGITRYGNHTYVFNYTITGFVLGASDSDIVYWTLFPKNNASPNNVDIKIFSDNKYEDTLDVWGYGKYGAPAYVYDGVIEMSSAGTLYSSEYMAILVKFPKNTFNTKKTTVNDFDYYYYMAEEGAVTYTDTYEEDMTEFSVLVILFCVIAPLFLVFISPKTKYKYGETGKKISKNVPFYRDIPCNKDIFRAYYLLNVYENKKSKSDSNFLGAVILKWIKNGNVTIETIDKEGIFKNKKVTNINFVNNDNMIPLEERLYKYMKKASLDGKLETKEFERWCFENSKLIFKWFDDVIDYEEKLFKSEGKINIKKYKKYKFVRYTEYYYDESLKHEAEKLKGLEKFLKEFTIIKERAPIEVALWNEYLIFAQIFGIAKEVAKQFENLYPEIMPQINEMGYNYDTIFFISSISSRGITSTERARHIERAQSYSSGGGGFSSGGGGGGSFGGGGGGAGSR